MSSENVELVGRVFSVGNPGLYQLISAATEDFVWDTTKFEGCSFRRGRIARGTVRLA